MLSRDQTVLFFFFNDTATTEIYTLSLHDALPIYRFAEGLLKTVFHYGPIAFNEPTNYEARANLMWASSLAINRSEEHTSELQSRQYLVCRLLLEKKKTNTYISDSHSSKTYLHH